MAPRSKKLGLTVPTDPRPRGFDTPSSDPPLPLSITTAANTSTTFSYYSAFFSPRLLRPAAAQIYTIPPPSGDSHIDPSETEQLQKLAHAHAPTPPPPPPSSKINSNSSTCKPHRLSKQLSMSETARDVYWERHRRRQILQYQERRKKSSVTDDVKNLTDEDLRELKGCIELGFGFNEENGQKLCNTLPALDLYFAVNRQLSSSSTGSTPPPEGRKMLSSSVESGAIGLGKRSTSLNSNRADDMRRLFGSGDDPQQVKIKLRHWAQAVACSVMQSPNHPKNESNGRKSLS